MCLLIQPLGSHEYKPMPSNLAMLLPWSRSVSILANWSALLTIDGKLIRSISMTFKAHCF